MLYCSQCGVEVEDYVEVCPLCSAPIPKKDSITAKKRSRFPDKPVIENQTGVFRILAWEIVSVSLLTAFAIIVLTNLIVAGTITWAWYPMASLVTVWLLATFPLLLPKKPLLISILSAASVMIFLASIDLLDNWKFDWYYYMALPIAFMLIAVTSLVIMLSKKVKKKGPNIAAFILFGVGIIVLGLDLIINFALNKVIGLTWSLSVTIPIIFTAIFLLYIHYRLLKAVDVKKWFQL